MNSQRKESAKLEIGLLKLLSPRDRKKKRLEKSEQSLEAPRDSIKQTCTCIVGIQDEEREKGSEG